MTHQLITLCYLKIGWGGRIRTYECRFQRPVPYHLATPQYRRAGKLPTLSDSTLKAAEGRECPGVIVAPNRLTRKDAPTSFEFDRLNGASCASSLFKDPKYCRAAAAEQCRRRAPTFINAAFARRNLRFKLKYDLLKVVLERIKVRIIKNLCRLRT